MAPEPCTKSSALARRSVKAGPSTRTSSPPTWPFQEETARGPDFLRLANALSALYPKGSEDKRLLDATLLAAPRR
jgi:hypothetical protein